MTRRIRTLFALLGALSFATAGRAQIGAVQTLAPGVYFHEGDPRLGTCNNGWIVMADYVIEVDANFPVGAKIVIPKIRALTDKPIRYVVDTHFHPDHASGNQLWAKEGATIVSQEWALEKLRDGGTAAWGLLAKTRHDVAGTTLKLPDLVYHDKLAFDDGARRVELRWPGIAHTHGDTLVWLPKEKILFTGDVAVNGSFNYLHDCVISEWIKALGVARALGAEKVCPGHGPMGGPEILEDQQSYFIALQAGVKALVDAGKSPAEAKAAGRALAAEMKKSPRTARYVPSDFWFGKQVETVYSQIAGTPLPE